MAVHIWGERLKTRDVQINNFENMVYGCIWFLITVAPPYLTFSSQFKQASLGPFCPSFLVFKVKVILLWKGCKGSLANCSVLWQRIDIAKCPQQCKEKTSKNETNPRRKYSGQVETIYLNKNFFLNFSISVKYLTVWVAPGETISSVSMQLDGTPYCWEIRIALIALLGTD